MQHSDHPAKADAQSPSLAGIKSRPLPGADLLPEIRRYLMMRSVLFGIVVILLLLHLIAPSVFDFATLLLLGIIYLLAVGQGGLEAARLSGTGGDLRRQERLAEDALRRAGRLQSNLEPGSSTDDVVNRILASGSDPRRMVIVAGNEVEDAVRAVYRHFSEAERMAGTSNGSDLPLTFLVQELIWRGLLSPDIYDTAEPILALRDMAMAPRAQIQPHIANDIARATQAVVLRVQSLGIEIHPRRVPLAWLRSETVEQGQAALASNEPAEEPVQVEIVRDDHDIDEGEIVDGDRLEVPMLKEPVASREQARREPPSRSTGGETGDHRT